MALKKLFTFVLLLLVLSAVVLGFWAKKQLQQPLALKKPYHLQIKSGESLYHVASKLHKDGILAQPKLWVWFARALPHGGAVQAGYYQINTGQNAIGLLQKLASGDVQKFYVTLLEGWTSAQAIKALQESEGIISTVNIQKPKALLQRLNAKKPFTHIEGIFYPDTYQYIHGTKDIEILQIAFKRTANTLEQAWQNRAKNLPYKNAYEALIMASIIEKETAVASEREQIAGVFVARLQKGMRLQTDPTVIYGMGDSYQGNIRRKDLTTKTPYNTYRINGLPPTPIALATEASIHAALNPLLNGKLYFVAKGDGYHYFSENFTQHQNAVRKYQLNRKKNYRSQPKKEAKIP